MPELIAKSALAGHAPVTLAQTTLSEAHVGPITSIACFPGALAEVTARLGAFPAPNTVAGNLIWSGPEQAFLLGEAANLAGLAAVTDQTGGWAALRLTGPNAADALMRLYPLDLRKAHFPPGTCARSLGHMQSILIREADSFLLLVFRSMARTAWLEVETALHALEARAAAGV